MNRVRSKNIGILEERATHVALCDSVGSYFRHWCGAFTLAEVLITLGIIGIVAAMTIPSLVQDYREKAQVTRVKKFYSVFAQAYAMALQDLLIRGVYQILFKILMKAEMEFNPKNH